MRDFVANWIANHRVARLAKVEKILASLTNLYDDGIKSGYEYTEGFHKHLQRRIDELAEERTTLRGKLGMGESTHA